jgi:hypothetical protein
MKITVQMDTKIRIAKSGPVRTFGDYDKRKQMNGEELVTLFDHAWATGLERAMERSLPCEFEVARARLKGRQQEFLDADEEQRQFRHQEMEFIAQWKPLDGSGKELTQLWKVQSGDDYPKTIFVTFETVEERQQFRETAITLGWDDEQLALSLLRDFMAKLRNVAPPEKS